MSTDSVVSFAPAPRPMWILFHDGDPDAATFALMPGWMTLDSDGTRWVAFTWMNTMGQEVSAISDDASYVIRVWDSANGRPSLGNVMKCLVKAGASDDTRRDIARDYDAVMGEEE